LESDPEGDVAGDHSSSRDVMANSFGKAVS
jgi:hypothetical protein